MKTWLSALVDQELDGPGVAVSHLAREGHRVRAEPIAQRRVEIGGGSDLDDLLVATLDRTVPLEEVNDISLVVR